MSDNKKSILDFVNRSNQQMAARRKQQQQEQQQSNSSSSTSNPIPQQLTPAQQMQQKQQQTGSTVMNTNDNRFSNTTSAQQHQQSSFYTSQNFYGVGNNNNNNLSRADSMISSSSTSSATNTARERAEKTKNMLETWADKIEAFVNDGSQTKLEMPTLLSGADRRELHQLASKFNLSHSSVGVGTQRRLVITKDALFFQGNLKGVGNTGVGGGDNATMTATTSSLIEQQTKSRGQVRRERQEQRANQDEKDLYADKNAIKAFRKYQKHVDSHANAVALAEDDILLQEDEEALLNSIGNNNNNDTNEDDEENENNTSEQLHRPHHEAHRRPREEDEDGNNRKNNNNDDNDVDAAIGNDDEHPAVVSIPEPEYMSTEQIEEACRVNEISEDDIEWIRTFSEEHSSSNSQQKETENVVFCIDFSDFVSSCTALARIRALSNGKKKIVIVELTAEKQNDDDDDDSSCSYKCMKNQFKELLNFAKSSSSSVDQDEICLSLPGMSLFGEALKIAVAIPVDSGSDAERLASALGNKFGSASVRVV